MSYPLLLITGEAGSGKDTVAGIVAERSRGVCIAQADPLKRLAKMLFNFTDEQLWGPSEKRNAVDPRWTSQILAITAQDSSDMRWCRYIGAPPQTAIETWMDDVLKGAPIETEDDPRTMLYRWYKDTLRECWKREAVTPRYVLQTLGTEWGRHVGKNLWVNYALRTVHKLLGGGHTYDRATGLTKNENVQGPGLVIITDGRFRNEVLATKALGGKVWKIYNPEDTSSQAAAVGSAGVAGHASETQQKSIPDHFYDIFLINDKRKGLEDLEDVVEDAIAESNLLLPAYSVG